MIDLEAIRKRNERSEPERHHHPCPGADYCICNLAERQQRRADIDALLAEVKRLREGLCSPVRVTLVCAKHGPIDRACECLQTLTGIHLGERLAKWEPEISTRS